MRSARQAGALGRWEGWRLVARYRRARRLALHGRTDRAFRVYVRLERRLLRLLAASGQPIAWAGMLVAEVQAAMGSLLKSAGFDRAAEGVAGLREALRDLVALGELDDASGRRLEEKLYASARALLQGRPCRGALLLEDFLRIVRGLDDSGQLSEADVSSLLEEGGELEATIARRHRA